MSVSIRTLPSPAKSWALPITPSAAGITVGAGSVRFIGERFDVPETFIPCVYEDEPIDYRISLCRDGAGGAALVLTRDRVVPDGYEEIIYLAEWRLSGPDDTCETVDVRVVHRVRPDPDPLEVDPDDPDAETPEPEPLPIDADPDTVIAVAASPVVPAISQERIDVRSRRERIDAINAKGQSASTAERVERLEIITGAPIGNLGP